MKEIQKSYTQVCSTTKRCCEKAAGGEKAEDRRQNTEDRSQKSEGWRVGRLAKKSEEEKGLWVPNQRNKRNQLEV